MLRGEQKAFDDFFEGYAGRLAAFASRRSSLGPSELEDVVQLTMINAIRSLSSFRGASSLFTWLCQICRNQLIDARRKSERRPKISSLEELTEHRSTAEIIELIDHRDPLEECADDSERDAVRRAINQVPANYARILELRFGDNLTVHEIARLLQLSESAAESRLVRARQAFREIWTEARASGEAARGKTKAPR